MKIRETSLSGVLVIEPQAFDDDRGFFMETFNAALFEKLGLPTEFAQDNHSFSRRNVLRGLHYQEPNPQGKLVRVVQGTIWDVAVDIRKGSPTFSTWVGETLSGENRSMMWVPPGFAHGFCILSDTADVIYKCTAVYDSAADRTIRFDDGDLDIDWPVEAPRVSRKDGDAPLLREALVLPEYRPIG